ncbi:MAG: leucine-rich repeat protein [Ruminococcus sp.]|nr:leucine-rich repeat protein [Ruminococcus sp.]
MKTRITSLVLVLVLLLTSIPLSAITASAATDYTEPTFVVQSVYAEVGSTVDVKIDVKNNPGIAGATLNIDYDSNLTLIGATNGNAFSDLTLTLPGSFNNPSKFLWDSLSGEVKADDTILILKFRVSEDTLENSNLNVNVSYQQGDIYNEDMEEVSFQTVNGCVTVINYIPGDVNDDGIINGKDVTSVRRHIVGGYEQTIVEEAADVNADSRINGMDVTLIRRHIVDGTELKPAPVNCNHNMTFTEYKAATCEVDGNIAYWHCSACNKYFSDEKGTTEITLENTVINSPGHNEIADEGTPATPTKPGYKPGVWCDKCETWIRGHEQIEPIESNESNISYRHYVRRENKNGNIEIVYDDYLSTHEIVNPNPDVYVEGEGITELIEGVAINNKQVSAKGYSFLGWYEKPETTASRVYSIPADAKGDKILYGVWSKNEYTITYLPDSASSILPKVENGSFTVDVETSLEAPPSWPNMVWVGWSDANGKIVKSIPKGTADNVTLTANWMSKRSQTVPNTKYKDSKPAIAIDKENGIYAFTYEIGDIQNVPIQQFEEGVDGKGFNLVKGQTHQISTKIIQKTGTSEATSVANTISNSTTKSDSWTLSEDWNKSTSFSQEHSSEVSQEQSQKAAISLTESGKYSISSGIGGSEEHIDETGKSTKTTKKNEFGVSANVGIKAETGPTIIGPVPFKNITAEANVGMDYKHTKETTEETHETHTDKTSSYWNVNEGFEVSNSLSQSNEFAQSISQSIKDTYKYGETLDFGGSKSNTVSSSNTSSESREYSSSVTYSTEEGKEFTVNETFTADADTGFYRKVLAANFRVFAVVIYNMKSSTFSTMTYSLKINDSEHPFTDYSTVSSFNDYENGVLPFEVPTYVSDYVYGLVGASEGLKINDETGVVEGYGFKDPATGICYKKYDEFTDTYSEPCDTDVIIPHYVVISVDNNEKKIVPVTGISASAFSGTTVTSVYLSTGITKIPEGAFKDCKSLKYVHGGNINTIEDYAFKNCTSLFELEIPATVETLGVGAFDGVSALTVNVSKASVLDSALAFDVKKLSLDLEKLSDSIDGKKVVTPENIEYFSLSGGGKTFNNISFESSADTFVLNNITINNYVDVPLKLSSANVELGFVSINSNSLIIRLSADNTIVKLDGNNYFTSSGKNAVFSKNIRFIEKEGTSASGKLKVAGNVLVFGTANGTQRVTFDSENHTFIYLTQEEYENMLNSHYIRFDANGGEVETDNKLVMWNSEIGELPVPSRDGCTFLGWYTEDGTQVTAETVFTSLEDCVVKAYWESGWVTTSAVPTDAEVTSEKWKYDLTSYTTSNSSTAPAGYSQYKAPTWEWGPYGSWSGWSKTKATASDSRQVEQRTVTDKAAYTNYRYWIYRDANHYYMGTKGWNGCNTYYEINLTYQLSLVDSANGLYGYCVGPCGHSNCNRWFFGEATKVPAVTHVEYRYRDRSKKYTYYFSKVDAKESTSDPTGQKDVSNVVKYVKYVVK